MAASKKMSFNATIKTMIEPQQTAGVLGQWTLAGEDLTKFFQLEDKENPNLSLSRIAETVKASYGEGTPELFLARLIIGNATNFPASAGSGLGVRTKAYVSEQQEAHDNLKKTAQSNIESFIENDPVCQQLIGLKVDTGGGKMKSIHPKLHMRDAKAVIDSYESSGGVQAAPVTAIPAAPIPEAPVAQAPQAAPAPLPVAPIQQQAPAPPAPVQQVPTIQQAPLSTGNEGASNPNPAPAQQIPPVPILPSTPQAAPTKRRKGKKQ